MFFPHEFQSTYGVERQLFKSCRDKEKSFHRTCKSCGIMEYLITKPLPLTYKINLR